MVDHHKEIEVFVDGKNPQFAKVQHGQDAKFIWILEEVKWDCDFVISGRKGNDMSE